jgi:hypothetical protein
MKTRMWSHAGMRRLVAPALLVLLLGVVAVGVASARGARSAAAPTIMEVTPATAPNTGPVTVAIKGSGYDTHGRLTAKLVRGSATITADARAMRDNLAIAHFDLTGAAAGVYDVAIANPDGQQGTLSAAFTVTSAPQAKPRITKLTPATGKRKVKVTIRGVGFGATRAARCCVKFGSKKCSSYLSWSDAAIKCKVPAKAALGRVKVVVTTPAGASNSKTFTVKK